ncbi:MAG TPA: hypothetical protein VFT69_07645 [Pseudolabrys sp.]|jgi:ElaB/YqjD/DUF883 family membrane-anchored ribosome-binding protein|nr:hypothetical protein [Pseudolabrys sp.]
MTTRAANSAVSEEIAAIENLMKDVQTRVRRLSGQARSEASGASSDVGDFVSESLNNVMRRVRESAATMTQSAADEATRRGSDAVKKIAEEIEYRPLLMLGLAAGIGFLAGITSRR